MAVDGWPIGTFFDQAGLSGRLLSLIIQGLVNPMGVQLGPAKWHLIANADQ